MIYVTGDIHGEHDIHKLSSKAFSQQHELTRDDYVIVCGDFGLVWNSDASENHWLRWLEEKPFTLLFVDGNHENFDLLNAYPVEQWKGGSIHRIRENVLHLMRGQVFEIDGHTFFTMGGASSIDREYRIENRSWWSAELPSDEEYAEAEKNLFERSSKVDYIITHTAPSSLAGLLCPGGFVPDRLTRYLESLAASVSFGHWYFGHFHTDREITRFSALYNNILPLGPLPEPVRTGTTFKELPDTIPPALNTEGAPLFTPNGTDCAEDENSFSILQDTADATDDNSKSADITGQTSIFEEMFAGSFSADSAPISDEKQDSECSDFPLPDDCEALFRRRLPLGSRDIIESVEIADDAKENTDEYIYEEITSDDDSSDDEADDIFLPDPEAEKERYPWYSVFYGAMVSMFLMFFEVYTGVLSDITDKADSYFSAAGMWAVLFIVYVFYMIFDNFTEVDKKAHSAFLASLVPPVLCSLAVLALYKSVLAIIALCVIAALMIICYAGIRRKDASGDSVFRQFCKIRSGLKAALLVFSVVSLVIALPVAYWSGRFHPEVSKAVTEDRFAAPQQLSLEEIEPDNSLWINTHGEYRAYDNIMTKLAPDEWNTLCCNDRVLVLQAVANIETSSSKSDYAVVVSLSRLDDGEHIRFDDSRKTVYFDNDALMASTSSDAVINTILACRSLELRKVILDKFSAASNGLSTTSKLPELLDFSVNSYIRASLPSPDEALLYFSESINADASTYAILTTINTTHKAEELCIEAGLARNVGNYEINDSISAIHIHENFIVIVAHGRPCYSDAYTMILPKGISGSQLRNDVVVRDFNDDGLSDICVTAKDGTQYTFIGTESGFIFSDAL